MTATVFSRTYLTVLFEMYEDEPRTFKTIWFVPARVVYELV